MIDIYIILVSGIQQNDLIFVYKLIFEGAPGKKKMRAPEWGGLEGPLQRRGAL